jgi:hypothetical protein
MAARQPAGRMGQPEDLAEAWFGFVQTPHRLSWGVHWPWMAACWHGDRRRWRPCLLEVGAKRMIDTER